MAILDFLQAFFGKNKSASMAKERLRIVLIQDQSSVSPELMNILRTEMVNVVSRYLEIDTRQVEMGIERKNGTIALAASIPITRIKKEARSAAPKRAVGSKVSKPAPETPVETALEPILVSVTEETVHEIVPDVTPTSSSSIEPEALIAQSDASGEAVQVIVEESTTILEPITASTTTLITQESPGSGSAGAPPSAERAKPAAPPKRNRKKRSR